MRAFETQLSQPLPTRIDRFGLKLPPERPADKPRGTIVL